jgi:hypothetical protein
MGQHQVRHGPCSLLPKLVTFFVSITVFPQEDKLEESVKELHKQRVTTEKTLKEETKAVDFLEKANNTMTTAASNIQDAISFSMMGM